ncbi:MAG: glutamate formimidoyltransferase [Acidimicrobiales bacterium]
MSPDEPLECVPNLSEGRDPSLLGRLAAVAGSGLLDIHADPDHHRSVFTVAGPDVEEAVRALARLAVAELDLSAHAGAHPRLGVIDVVPFVPLGAGAEPAHGADTSGAPGMGAALGARDRFAGWAADELDLPCFLYGPERSLPEVRRRAFRDLAPDIGPNRPHPRAGAVAVGARGVMVAYNLWLEGQSADSARSLAARLRSPQVRALGFDLNGRAQLSFNLIDPLRTGPVEVYDRAAALGARIERAELVGLVPAALLEQIPSGRWAQLGLRPEATIEARLEGRARSG